MSRFRLIVKDHGGTARLLLTDEREIIGMANISWRSYELITRALMDIILEISRKSIKETLSARLWQDAQTVSENSAELAMRKLAELGFTQEKIEAYAEELAKNLAQELIEYMPEVK